MSPGPLRRASGSQLVYAALRERILTGALTPGDRLKESELAAALGVSRTPYREAVRLLMAEGFLEQQATGGVTVRGMSARDIDELYAVRAALEGLMAQTAATTIDEAGIDRLRALLERNARLVDLPTEAMNAGHELHLEIGRIAGNAWADRLHADVDAQMIRYRNRTNESPARREAALREHEGIVDALAARDPAAARSRAEAHVQAAREAALATLTTTDDPARQLR